MKGSLAIKNGCVVYLEGTPFMTKALDDVTLSIAPGEIVGLIGSTGSGKSTLVQALNGLVPLSSGEIEYPEGYDSSKLFESIGLVFQQPEDQLFERTVEEDVGFGPAQLGLDEQEIRARVERALDALGLKSSEYVHRNPLELSGGEKRRVAIAGILSMEPDMLILDEPTAGLDHRGRNLLLKAIENLHKKRNLSLIIISHDMDLLAALAHRIAVLHKGKVVCDGPPKELFADKTAMRKTGLRPPVPVDILCRLQEKGISVEPSLLSADKAASAIIKAVKKSSKGKGKK